MALTNAILVRYDGGFHFVEDLPSILSFDRREGYLTLGGVTSIAEVERITRALLTDLASPAVTTTVGLQETTGDTPYNGTVIGSHITAPDPDGVPTESRVVGISVAEDEMGDPTFVPELGSLREERDRNNRRWLKRMVNGTLSGVSETATPVNPKTNDVTQGGDPPRELPPFSYAGTVQVDTSGRYYPPQSVRVVEIVASLGTAGSTQTSLDVLKNGVAVSTVIIAASSNKSTLTVDFNLNDGDYVQVRTTGAGTGAKQLDVQMRYV